MMVRAPKVTPGPHLIAKHGQQFDICSRSYYQVPIDVAAGWAASPDDTRLPGFHLNKLCILEQYG